MSDDRYGLEESLRLIGKSLDRKLSPPERSEKILQLLRVLSEIDVPLENAGPHFFPPFTKRDV